MKGEVKVPYVWDLRTSRTVYVDEVATGLACGLLCPDCGERLQAKNAGGIRAHHFAHNNPSPTCEGLLHSTVKRVLFQRMTKTARSRFTGLATVAPAHIQVIY